MQNNKASIEIIWDALHEAHEADLIDQNKWDQICFAMDEIIAECGYPGGTIDWLRSME